MIVEVFIGAFLISGSLGVHAAITCRNQEELHVALAFAIICWLIALMIFGGLAVRLYL